MLIDGFVYLKARKMASGPVYMETTAQCCTRTQVQNFIVYLTTAISTSLPSQTIVMAYLHINVRTGNFMEACGINLVL